MTIRTLFSSLLSVAVLLFSASLGSAALESYEIDSSHSSISFKVRHFFSKIPGSFNNFTGHIHYDPEYPANNYAEAEISAKSIDTNHQKRDAHLNNEDFLDTPRYPKITFRSTQWQPLGDNLFRVTGDLTIMETTLPVMLNVELLGERQQANSVITT